jgi:hypothetical protein
MNMQFKLQDDRVKRFLEMRPPGANRRHALF